MSDINLSNLKAPKGATRKRKRVGRGEGSTLGKTAGRGQKGQKSRSGGSVPIGFEGGQMPLHRRLPKFGFTNPNSVRLAIVNVEDLEGNFEDGDTVDAESLLARGMVRKNNPGIKVLGNGELTKKLTVRAHKFSDAARSKVEEAGGTAEVI